MSGHDLREGIWGRKKMLLIPCVLALIPLCASLYLLMVDADSGSMGTFLFSMFAGTLSADTLVSGDVLEIPALWLLIQTGCLIYTIGYPMEDLEHAGLQFLLRGSGRLRWWLSKCVWCILSVCLYEGVLVGTTALFCVIRGIPLTLSVSSDMAFQILPNCDVVFETPYSGGVMFLHLILIPLLMMVALNLLQMLVSLFTQPLFGFVAAVVVLAWSLFQKFPLAIGNYGMMQRDSLFYSKGLDFSFAPPLLCLLSVGIIVVGCFKIKRKNILTFRN